MVSSPPGSSRRPLATMPVRISSLPPTRRSTAVCAATSRAFSGSDSRAARARSAAAVSSAIGTS